MNIFTKGEREMELVRENKTHQEIHTDTPRKEVERQKEKEKKTTTLPLA